MLLKECRRCHKLIPYGQTYCKECAPIVEKEREEQERARERKYNRKRDPKYLRFYRSKEWKALARKKLQDTQYKCEVCGRYATEVHHKQFIQTTEGWDKRFDYDGLESLCTKCHNMRHDRFKKKIWNIGK